MQNLASLSAQCDHLRWLIYEELQEEALLSYRRKYDPLDEYKSYLFKRSATKIVDR